MTKSELTTRVFISKADILVLITKKMFTIYCIYNNIKIKNLSDSAFPYLNTMVNEGFFSLTQHHFCHLSRIFFLRKNCGMKQHLNIMNTFIITFYFLWNTSFEKPEFKTL